MYFNSFYFFFSTQFPITSRTQSLFSLNKTFVSLALLTNVFTFEINSFFPHPAPVSIEEKRPAKRSYQKVQEEEEEEDDDYRSHASPHTTDATAALLVGGTIVQSSQGDDALN